MVEREIRPNLKANIITKTGEATTTKIGVHAFDIYPYLHKFFEPILFNSKFLLPWSEREIWAKLYCK